MADNIIPEGNAKAPIGDYAKIKEGTFLCHGHTEDADQALVCCFIRRGLDSGELVMPPKGTYWSPESLSAPESAFQIFLGEAREILGFLPPKMLSVDFQILALHSSLKNYLEDENWDSGLWDDEDMLSKLRCLGEVIYGGPASGVEPLLDRMVAIEKAQNAGVQDSLTSPEEPTAHTALAAHGKEPAKEEGGSVQDSSTVEDEPTVGDEQMAEQAIIIQDDMASRCIFLGVIVAMAITIWPYV